VKRAVFIAATAQHVGKTTTCLGIVSGLQKRFSTVGFVKPVGQRYVGDEDEDVILFRDRFGMRAESPVIVPKGFTRDYLDERVALDDLKDRIVKGFDSVAGDVDYTVVEGTGHVGVGSIIDLSNADVAKMLNLEVVLVSTGGVGAAFDQLALNKVMLERAGVKVRGIILNKVIHEKREMICEYVPKALKKWGIPLVGCIPYSPLLHAPTMRDFADLFGVELFAGEQWLYRHIFDERFVATTKHHPALEQIEPRELIITHGSRDDIIRLTLIDEQRRDLERGLLLTGHIPPSDAIVEEIKKVGMPAIYVPLSSYKVLETISGYTAKIRSEDVDKVDKAISLVEEHIDFSIFE
jgi:phosphate acetyltransferase